MEIRKSPGRFLSILFIVALGVAFFSGIRASEPDMRLSGDSYFDKANLMDIKAFSTFGVTEDDIRAIEALDGVKHAEGAYSSDFLYKKYIQIPEGELTKKRASLVCEPSLAYCARDFGLPQYLLLGKGEDMTGGRNRDSIVSDATEALLGAIYLDGGFASAKEFVLKFILNEAAIPQ